MEGLFKGVIFFGAGYVFARYLEKKNPGIVAADEARLDAIRSSVHDLIKKYAPNADDVEIGNDVINTVK